MPTAPAFTNLDAFLALPECKPALDFYDGRIIQKMSPQFWHSLIHRNFLRHLDDFGRQHAIGRAYPELRWTSRGISVVPDLCFLPAGANLRYERGDPVDRITFPPHLAIEILSPGQAVRELRRKLRSQVRRGVRLGWLVDPQRRTVAVVWYRARTVTLAVGQTLSGEDVIPGYTLPLAELFGWLQDF